MLLLALLLVLTVFGQSGAFLMLPLYNKVPVAAPGIDDSSILSPTSLRALWDKLDEVMDTFVVKTLFPEENEKDAVDPEEVLATFDLRSFNNSSSGLNAAYSSLTNYLQLWARQLELQPDKGLTTPITATDFRNATSSSYAFLDESSTSSTSVAEHEEDSSSMDPLIENHQPMVPPNVSMTLKFRPPKRYLSYKEQKSMEKGVLPDRKGAKVDAWSPGGIQLLVTVLEVPSSSLSLSNQFNDGDDDDEAADRGFQLTLEARRCDIDGDTVIKYSSERAIIRRLKEAIRIWIKVRAMPSSSR
jgi:hypothetical protein